MLFEKNEEIRKEMRVNVERFNLENIGKQWKKHLMSYWILNFI